MKTTTHSVTTTTTACASCTMLCHRAMLDSAGYCRKARCQAAKATATAPATAAEPQAEAPKPQAPATAPVVVDLPLECLVEEQPAVVGRTTPEQVALAVALAEAQAVLTQLASTTTKAVLEERRAASRERLALRRAEEARVEAQHQAAKAQADREHRALVARLLGYDS